MMLVMLGEGEVGSRVTPRMRGWRARGRGVLLTVTVGCEWDWRLSGVKRETVDLGAEMESPRSSTHSETWSACSLRVAETGKVPCLQ